MKKILMIMTASLLAFSACNSEKKEEKEDKDKMTTSNGESQEEKNKATALASMNAMISGDVDAVLKDVASDGVDYGDGSMPPTKGVDSIKAGLKAWRGSLSELKVDNLWAIADGDNVAVFGDWSATYKDDFMGMKTAGKSYKLKDVDYFKFNSEGKMTEHHSIQSSCAMFSQLGIAPPK